MGNEVANRKSSSLELFRSYFNTANTEHLYYSLAVSNRSRGTPERILDDKTDYLEFSRFIVLSCNLDCAGPACFGLLAVERRHDDGIVVEEQAGYRITFRCCF